MTFRTVSRRDYEVQKKHCASIFDNPAFVELNSMKCDRIIYGFFADSKIRLGLAAGIKEGWLRAPFSAPYACFSWISSAPKTGEFQAAIEALTVWARESGLLGIGVTLPPSIYNDDVISKAANAFFSSRFHLEKIDLNFAYDLSGHDSTYADQLDIKARQKLRASKKEGFILTTADTDSEFAEAYEIIRLNREHRGFPLKMSYAELMKTARVAPAQAFILRGSDRAGAASAICFRTQARIAQVIYWGNRPEAAKTNAMNNLAMQLFDYYKKEGLHLVDTGPSTEDGVANIGLSDFKQSIGCVACTKLSFNLAIS